MKPRDLTFISLSLVLCLFGSVRAERVKFLIMGDPQKIMDAKHGKQDDFIQTMEKLVTDPVTRDADFLLHMGDIVESDKDNSDRPEQYAVARAGFKHLDGKMPYVLNVGNNDDAAEFQAAFPLKEYSDAPSFAGNLDRHQNVAHHFQAGGADWLVLSLRFKAGAAEVDWAEGLIRKHAGKNVILINHEMNNAVETMAKKHENVVFLLCGHTRTKIALEEGDSGQIIGWIKTCWHSADLDSFLCLIDLDTEKGTVHGRYYSPLYGMFGDNPSSALYQSDRNPMADKKSPFKHPWSWSGFAFAGNSQ